MGGERRERWHPVQVASIDTLHRMTHLPAADIIIVDEAHSCSTGGQGRQLRFELLKQLADDAALEDYLIEKATGNAKITLADGRVAVDDELAEIVESLRQTTSRIRRLAAAVPVEIVEQAAMAGILTPDMQRALEEGLKRGELTLGNGPVLKLRLLDRKYHGDEHLELL